MPNPPNDSDQTQDDKSPPSPRLPYEPPAVMSEEVFETLAAICGKLGGAKCQLGGGTNS